MSISNLYHKYCKNILRMQLLLTCTMCILLSSCSSESKKNEHVAECIVEDGLFIQKEEVLNRIFNNIQFIKNEKLKKNSESETGISFESKDGYFELYFFGDVLFFNAFWKNIEQQYNLRDIAAFVQCFYKDKTYKDILDYMEEQCENRPDNEYELDDGYFAIDNVFFDITSIEKMGFDKGVHMEVFPWGINYDQINPKRMLYYLCLKEEKNAWDIIEEMSDSEAHELVDYYRNHEKDDIRGFNSLCKAAGVDYNIGSSDQEPIIISTPEPEKHLTRTIAKNVGNSPITAFKG